MTNALLLVNAGSSSLKLALWDAYADEQLATATIDWSGKESTLALRCGADSHIRTVSARDAAAAFKYALPEILDSLSSNLTIQAVGHRVVHGGELASAELINDNILGILNALCELAPLHNPPSLAVISLAREIYPRIPHVAIFDTAFHRNMRPEAKQYAVPQHWSSDWQIKRYGFHGLSHSYCCKRAADLLRRTSSHFKVIVCHLGHGCSATAVADGRSVDTTMGFTPLEGLMMATRCGSIDAGALLYVQERHRLTSAELSRVLNQQSGLLGVSGISSDMRQILQAAERGDAQAALAVSMFCYRVQQAIGALMVSLEGADALVFTAGIGENSAHVRQRVCDGIRFLGFTIDDQLNARARPDTNVSAAGSPAQVLVIASREDVSMLGELRGTLLRT